ncbi:16328_t:CDS:2, partial [Funneliformis geosporum]
PISNPAIGFAKPGQLEYKKVPTGIAYSRIDHDEFIKINFKAFRYNNEIMIQEIKENSIMLMIGRFLNFESELIVTVIQATTLDLKTLEEEPDTDRTIIWFFHFSIHSAVAESTKSSAIFSVAGELFIGTSLIQIICSEIERSFPNAVNNKLLIKKQKTNSSSSTQLMSNSTVTTSNSLPSTSNLLSSEESRKRSEMLIQALDRTNKKDKIPIHKNEEDENRQNNYQSNESNESNNDIAFSKNPIILTLQQQRTKKVAVCSSCKTSKNRKFPPILSQIPEEINAVPMVYQKQLSPIHMSCFLGRATNSNPYTNYPFFNQNEPPNWFHQTLINASQWLKQNNPIFREYIKANYIMQPSPTMQIPKPYPTAKPSKDYTHNKNSKISPTNSNESEVP